MKDDDEFIKIRNLNFNYLKFYHGKKLSSSMKIKDDVILRIFNEENEIPKIDLRHF